MTSSHALRRRILGGTLVALVGATALTVAPTALAAPQPKTSSFTASISPTKATVGVPTTFAITVTNARTSVNDIGSVQVLVPAAFASVTLGATTVPSGFVYSIAPCSSDSPGAPTCAGTLVQVSTPSNGGAQKIGPGVSLTFSVTANPTAAAKGATPWLTAAKNSAAWSTGQLLTLTGGSPVVTVYGAATQLAFGTAPPLTLVAGGTFSTTVRVLDADGDLVPSTASVTLAGTGLQGTVTLAAADGTASFSGLSLWTAGTIAVTAASTGLTSASANVVVTPGKPAALVVTGPSGAVGAGTTFAVGARVNDAYGNAVDPQVTVALSVDGTSRGSQTTVGGSTSFDVVAPTSPGSHSLTVSTSGTFAGSGFSLTLDLPFTVTAGPATHVSIDSVSAPIAKDDAFTVVVTARDAYENPASYTGLVTLATSGGTGSALGSLGGTTTAGFAGGTTATISGATYSGYGNSIALSASGTGLSDNPSGTDLTCPPADGSVLSSSVRCIDVYAFITARDATPRISLTVDNSGCTDATPGVPVCSSLILSNGANGRVTLGQQICNPFTPCLNGNENQANLVEALANLRDTNNKPLYTKAAPAVLEFRCDKTLCGGTGVNNFPILFQVTGDTLFTEAQPCTTKGRIGANQDFCADVKANKRDNAGDLVATVLFLEDLRSTIRP